MYIVSTPDAASLARPNLRPRVRTSRTVADAASIKGSCKLADLVQLAIGLDRAAAEKNAVRLRGYTVDTALPSDDERKVLDTLDRLIGCAVRKAHRGSLVTAEARYEHSEMRLRLRFAVPAPRLDANPTGIDWIDELWSWDPANRRAGRI